MNREYVQVSDKIVLRTDKGLKTMNNYNNLNDILIIQNKIEKNDNLLDELSISNEKTKDEASIYNSIRKILYGTPIYSIVFNVVTISLTHPYNEIYDKSTSLKSTVIYGVTSIIGYLIATNYYKKYCNSKNNISINERKIEDLILKNELLNEILDNLRKTRVVDNTVIDNQRYCNLEQYEEENNYKYNNLINNYKKILKKEN